MGSIGCVIEGVVRTTAGTPVVEARVLFTTAPVEMPDIAALSDETGRFVVYAPQSGHYELAVVAEQLQRTDVAIDVSEEDESLAVEIELAAE